VGTFQQKVAQQSRPHPKQKAAIIMKQILWTITLEAAWHTSAGPAPMFLCTGIKERQVGVNSFDHPWTQPRAACDKPECLGRRETEPHPCARLLSN